MSDRGRPVAFAHDSNKKAAITQVCVAILSLAKKFAPSTHKISMDIPYQDCNFYSPQIKNIVYVIHYVMHTLRNKVLSYVFHSLYDVCRIHSTPIGDTLKACDPELYTGLANGQEKAREECVGTFNLISSDNELESKVFHGRDLQPNSISGSVCYSKYIVWYLTIYVLNTESQWSFSFE